LEAASWTFSECGHGKSAADGVGAVIKRSAHLACISGSNVENAHQLQGCLTEGNIETHVVSGAFIDKEVNDMPHGIPLIPACNKLHQAVWTKDNGKSLVLKDVPCPCIINDWHIDCVHYGFRKWRITSS
jgi:hypothetical protein